MDTELGWLAVALLPGVGIRTFHRLIRRFGSPDRIFRLSSPELARLPGLKAETIEAIRNLRVKEIASREMAKMQSLGIRLVRWGTALYPEYLTSIVDPPPLLYVKGELSQEDRRAVAVVGSRRASAYGLSVCKKLCAELAWNGWTVVSGMARGIDSAAHLGALAGEGRTLAVLGSGLDVIYPPENWKLCQRIAAAGAVLTEFPLGTPPEPGNFPIRNRLISGLALGVVVVEATMKSGSLITARMALDQGRQVFAVPGSVVFEGAAGPHQLIKQGAKLVERAEDIIEELVPMVGQEPGATAKREIGRLAARPKLDEMEERLWNLLTLEPLHIDAIARQLQLSVSQAAELLLRMEIRGMVKQLPGSFFVRGLDP